MDATFTAEQDEIRRTLRELLLKRCGPEEVKTAVQTEGGYDSSLWETLAQQLGLPGLAFPEAYGGVGCSVTELALASEELGRSSCPFAASRHGRARVRPAGGPRERGATGRAAAPYRLR